MIQGGAWRFWSPWGSFLATAIWRVFCDIAGRSDRKLWADPSARTPSPYGPQFLHFAFGERSVRDCAELGDPPVLIHMAVGPIKSGKKNARKPAEGERHLNLARHVGVKRAPSTAEESFDERFGIVDTILVGRDQTLGQRERRTVTGREKQGLPKSRLLLGARSLDQG